MGLPFGGWLDGYSTYCVRSARDSSRGEEK